MKFDSVYYEPDSLKYPLGIRLREMFQDLPWIPIENHNSSRKCRRSPTPSSGG